MKHFPFILIGDIILLVTLIIVGSYTHFHCPHVWIVALGLAIRNVIVEAIEYGENNY